MKKLLTWIIGVALFLCGFSANAGNNFNVLDKVFARDYIVDVASSAPTITNRYTVTKQ